MAQSQLDRDFENAIAAIVKGIGHGIKMVFCGLKKLNSIKNIAGLLLFVAVAIAAYTFRPNLFVLMESAEMPSLLQKALYIVLLGVPFIYLGILGGATDRKAEEYYKIFREIEFKGKDGKYPYFIDVHEDEEKRTVFLFKTSINISDWKKNQERLELALDCTILRINNKGSRRMIELITLPSDYELSIMVKWQDDKAPAKESCLAVGEGVLGQVSFDLNKTPHVLVAGETGSGKSVILHVLLWQMIFKCARVIMFDFKGGVEFGLDYEQYGEVITERERAEEILDQLVQENALRLALFRKCRVKNIAEYNEKTGSNLSRIGVFCDEIAEMLDMTGVPKKDREIYEKIKGQLSTLARLSRSTGINLIMGAQRPDANILTGQIKNNIPVRICGRFADKAPSEIVLNTTAAMGLPETKGRFLFLRGNELIEFQAYFFADYMMTDIVQESGSLLIEQKPTDRTKASPVSPPKPEKTTDYGLDRYPSAEQFDFNYGAGDDLVDWSAEK